MSVLTQPAEDAYSETLESDSAKSSEPLDLTTWLNNGIAIGTILLAIIAAVAFLVIALDYRNQPFLGIFMDNQLEIQPIEPFGDELWSGREIGIQSGNRIIGAGDLDFGVDKPYIALDEVLSGLDSGDELQLTVEIEGQRGLPAADSCPFNPDPSKIVCLVTLTLDTLPLVDFVGHFVVGFIVGLSGLILAIAMMLRRRNQTSATFFAAIAATMAIAQLGRFNLISTHQSELVLIWIFAGSMLSGLLISFSMVFPNNLGVVERAPVIKYVPLIGALATTGLIYYSYDNGDAGAVLFPLVVFGASVVVMMLVMLWRRQYTSSPILREQASYILLGAFFGFVPVIIWTLYQLISSGDAPTWSTPLIQILSLLFLISTTYAIMEDRLLETDRLVPTILVYNVLGWTLIIAYAAIVTGLSSMGVDFISADSELVIASVVLIIALGFVPVRNRLRDRIDELWFRTRRHYQERLETVMENLTNAVTVNDVQHIVRIELDETLSPSDSILFVRDKEAQVFRAHENPLTGRPVTDITFQFDGGLAHYLQIESSILFLEDGKALPPTIFSDRARLAVLNTPILVRLKGQRQLNGFLAISGRRSGENYTYDDLQFIERVADQTALALERTQIVEDLEHRFRVQDVISQVSRALNYAIDLEFLLELLYAQTGRVIDADMFSVAITEQGNNQLYFAFYVEGDERLEAVEGRRWNVGGDLYSQVAQTQQVVRIDNYETVMQQRDPSTALPGTSLNIKAWVGAPLAADTATGTLGVMSVGTTDPTIRYNDEQVQLLVDIANLAASAIDKTRLFEATRARTAQLEVLNEISSQLSTEISDVDRLLDLITRSAMEIMKCQAGSLLLIDENTDDLVFRVALGPSGLELVGKRISRNEPSLVIEAVTTAEPVIVNDTSRDSRWHGEVVDADEDAPTTQHFHSRSVLTTPLIAQGEAVGAIQIINKIDGSLFTPDDATLLTTFAAQAAVAIQNARLYELQDQRLIQRVEELEGLAAIDKSLNQTLELQLVAEVALTWAIRQAHAKAGAIAMIDAEDSDEMWLVVSQGYPETSLFAETSINDYFPTNKGIWGRVIRTGTPAFARNLRSDPENNKPGDPDYIETYPNAVTQIIVPIVSASEVIGVMLVETDIETDLTLVDMEFLTRLADHASPAIANSQLFGALQHQQSARAEFVSFIAHELKNPMTSMKGYTDLLMRGVVGPLNEQQSNFLETIFNNVNRLEALINDLRDVERQDANQLRLDMAAVELPQIVRESMRSLEQAFDKKEQTTRLEISDDLPQVWGDQARLIQVMTNFLTNSNKYTQVGGEVAVIAEATINEWDTEGVRRVVHIQIKDNGIGMSDEDLGRIFKEKYFRSQGAKDSDEPGTGLGMVLTRGLILQHGGQVWVESVVGEGSTFHFTLPLADEILREAT